MTQATNEQPTTTLVLGSGASKPYGFPTGLELRNILIQLDPSRTALRCGEVNRNKDEHPGNRSMSDDELRQEEEMVNTLRFIQSSCYTGLMSKRDMSEFSSAFQYSATASIDTFLSHRKKFETIGKQAIAATILHYESKAKLHGWNWYALLWDKLRHYFVDKNKDREIPLKIITFNYDRSLEYFLFKAIQSISSESPSEPDALEQLRRITIIHVYGVLGCPLKYGVISCSSEEPWTAKKLAENINLIRYSNNAGDNHNENEERAKIKSIINDESKRLVFLGFGFDDQNSRLLGLKDALDKEDKTIYATNIGLTEYERIQCAKKLWPHSYAWPNKLTGSQEQRRLYLQGQAHDCMSLLRNADILSGLNIPTSGSER